MSSKSLHRLATAHFWFFAVILGFNVLNLLFDTTQRLEVYDALGYLMFAELAAFSWIVKQAVKS